MGRQTCAQGHQVLLQALIDLTRPRDYHAGVAITEMTAVSTLNVGNVKYRDMVLPADYVLLLPAHRRPARAA